MAVTYTEIISGIYICGGLSVNDTQLFDSILNTVVLKTAEAIGDQGTWGMSNGVDIWQRSTTTSTVKKYDVSADSWSTATSAPTAKEDGATSDAVVHVGEALGHCTHGDNSGALTTNERFIFDLDTWTTETADSVAERQNSAFAFGDTHYAGGGLEDAQRNVLRSYDNSLDNWFAGNDLSVGRYLADGGCINDLGVIAKGLDSGAAAVATMELFDPSALTWSTSVADSISDSQAMVGTDFAYLYCFGGLNNLKANRRYDPYAGTWLTRTDLLASSLGSSGAPSNNSQYGQVFFQSVQQLETNEAGHPKGTVKVVYRLTSPV